MSDKYKCDICLEILPFECIYKLKTCNCSYCTNCLLVYLNYKVAQVDPLICPNPYCQLPITDEELINLLSEEVYEEYMINNMLNETDEIHTYEYVQSESLFDVLIFLLLMFAYGCTIVYVILFCEVKNTHFVL